MSIQSARLISTAKTRTPRRYLLVPPEPTPNGRLHLGHIAGPFLRTDLMHRFLRMRGDHPLAITGSDVYEPYLTFKAAAEGRTEHEIATEYHALIAEDLRAMEIDIDIFINPAEEPWRSAFEEEVAGCLRRLESRGAVVTQPERVPYSRSAARFVVGPWLAGRCPDCESDVGSYFCEGCGGHFRPDNLRDHRGLGDVGPLEWREISSYFLRSADPEELNAQIVKMGVPDRFRRTVDRFLAREKGLVRLSAPEKWGMPLDAAEPGVPRTLFPYAGTFMFARLVGAIHGSISNSGVNAFDAGSGVTTVTSLGIDNVIPTLVCIVGTSLLHGNMKGYDRALINDFYLLEGQKFSTSRNHVIWAVDVARSPRVEVDAVRYFLARTRLEERPESLEPHCFVEVINSELVDRLTPHLRAARSQVADLVPEPVADQQLARLEQLLRCQETALDGPVVSTADAVAAFDLWCGNARWPEIDAYWWLKGVSVLGFPIMPGLSRRLWEELGGDGEPRLAAFLERTRPRRTGGFLGFERITLDDLTPLLPASSQLAMR